MGDMHRMPMSSPLLPEWLRVVWAIALCAVLLLHLWHARIMPGQRRWWHIGHTIMAAGMTVMYLMHLLPHGLHPPLHRSGAVLFGLLTVSLLGAAALLRRREGVLNPLWVASALDMLAMTYMLLPPSARPGPLTAVFVAYLAVQTVAWALGLWDRAPVFRKRSSATREHAPKVLDLPPAAPDTPATAGTATAPGGELVAAVGLTTHSTPAVRFSLAVMSASMGYMLLIV